MQHTSGHPVVFDKVSLSSSTHWPAAFAEEQQRLREALGDLAISIEHVGSTSIPGMPAKPVLDFLVAIRSFEQTAACVPAMEALGYTYRGELGISRRHYFVKGEPRTHHVHMLEPTHPTFSTMLDFRNHLRLNPAAVKEYADAKVELARTSPTKEVYQSAKDKVVEAILADMLLPNKVCPLMSRQRDGLELLAFRHPLAGTQLVKGTVEPGEHLRTAALRELHEESGIADAEIVADLGWYDSGHLRQVWALHLCQTRRDIPDTWVHHALEDTGYDFAFFWQPLSVDPDQSWHPAFANAFRHIRALLG